MTRYTRPFLLLVFCAALLLPGLGRRCADRQQELRVGICARNMAAGGSWLIPEFQNQPRLQKPPLMYWAVAGLYRLSAQPPSVFVTRLPGAVAGTLLILLIYAMGRRLCGEPSAWIAAWLAAGSLLFLRHARLAETDIPQTLWVSATLALLYAALRTRDRRRWGYWILAGIAAGLGFMTKGLAAAVIPLLLLGLYLIFIAEDRRRSVAWGVFMAALMASAITAPWYLYIAQWQQGADQVLSREVAALLGQTQHPGSILYYFYTLPLGLLPWGLLLYPAAGWSLRKGCRTEAHPGTCFIACWFWGSLLLLSLLPSKQAHYALLLLPPAALLTARWLTHRFPAARARLQHGVPIGALLLLLGLHVYTFAIYPQQDRHARLPAFLEDCRVQAADAPRIHVTGINSAIFDFYLGRHVENTETLQRAYAQAAPGDAIIQVRRNKNMSDADRIQPTAQRHLEHRDLQHSFYLKPVASQRDTE